MQANKTTLILATVAALLASSSLVAQGALFLRDSPIAWMDDTDREILRATLEAIVRSPDGTVTDWSNPATGSRSRIKVTDTHEDLGTTCRNIQMRNETKSRSGGGKYRLCLAEDETWKFAPNAADK